MKRKYQKKLKQIGERGGYGVYLQTKKQMEKSWSTQSLIREIEFYIKRLSKRQLVTIVYEIHKLKLPRLRRGKLRPALPKRKTKRKFSRKQLAAQRLFAKRARAGTLRKRRKR